MLLGLHRKCVWKRYFLSPVICCFSFGGWSKLLVYDSELILIFWFKFPNDRWSRKACMNHISALTSFRGTFIDRLLPVAVVQVSVNSSPMITKTVSAESTVGFGTYGIAKSQQIIRWSSQNSNLDIFNGENVEHVVMWLGDALNHSVLSTTGVREERWSFSWHDSTFLIPSAWG